MDHPALPLLVAIDESPTAWRAVEFAVALAARRSRAAIFCTAIDRAAIVAECAVPQGSLDPTPILDALEAGARELLGRARARAGASGTSASTALLDGAPADAIVTYAAACGAGAIVMGTQGKGALERFFLGSTAEGVLRGARIPTYVVPPVERDVTRPFARLLVAIDGDDPAASAAAFATELARAENARLTFAHAIAKPERRSAAEALLRSAAAAATARGVEAGFSVLEGDAAAELVRAATARGGDALVVGTHSGRGLRHRFLGSVAAGVVRHADVVTVVVPHA